MTQLESHNQLVQERQQQPDVPTLTSAIIQRAKEGLDAARDPLARRSVEESLEYEEAICLRHASAIAPNLFQPKINGEQRRRVLRILMHALFQVNVEFPERIPTTPAMLASNHLSHFDPFLILSEIPGRPLYHILGDARTLFNQGWKRYFLSLTGGVIPLDRLWKEELAVINGAKMGREDLAQLAAAIRCSATGCANAHDVPDGRTIEALRRIDRIVQAIFSCGDGIAIFPEGRLGTAEGQLHLPLKRGAAIYALRARVPIVPVGIIGTKDLYFRKKLTLKFGEPLIFPQSNRPKPQEIQAVLEALQAALIDLLPKDYQEPNELKLFRNFLNHLLW
jgi:1-acyl-sn-glycerol-3-phosphate acyltransferase